MKKYNKANSLGQPKAPPVLWIPLRSILHKPGGAFGCR